VLVFEFLVNVGKAGKIEIPYQKIELPALGDEVVKEFRHEGVLVGYKSRHRFSFA
jgi:hypothetical protein